MHGHDRHNGYTISSWKLFSNIHVRNTINRVSGHLSVKRTSTHTSFTHSFLEAVSIISVHATP